ncbi:uncharacterized protein PAC_18784 [Phialocephala subalpina]|uniref:Uncharacterized protein n=1 Tax=Phialocephala subalpina TaxID=576137 RepID=A0A1L7XV18_9HELO|nr:uncharacterized protein PAC_18784 [Phialocephala subalpina]
MLDHFTENTELAVGATSTIVAADQLLHAIDPHEDKTSHLVKAGIGAAIAIGAFELLRQQNEKDNVERGSRQLRRSGSYERSQSRSPSPSRSGPRSPTGSGSRSRSLSSHIPHHKRHIVEEIIGAYSLGKELLGDRKHHVAHLVGEALGATGIYQELRARDKQDEKERQRR